MIIPTYSRVGGAQDQLRILTSSLIEKGLDVGCFATGEHMVDLEKAENKGLLLSLLLRVYYELLSITHLVQKIRGYDVLHLHGLGISVYVASFLSIFFRKKLVVKIPRSGRGSYLNLVKSSKLRKLLFKLAAISIDKFIILTPDCKEELTILGVDEMKIEEIPNGVEVNDYSESVNALNLKVCFAGRLIKRKNIDMVLRVLSSIEENAVEFTVIGTGKEHERLIAAAKSLGVANKTSFIGEVSNCTVISIFKQNDVFVLPSNSEGMSNALLQAMSAGCVPVAFDLPQNRVVISQVDNRLLFKNEGELKDILLDLSDPIYRKSLSRKAYYTVAQRFSIDSVAEKYLDLYRRLA